MHGHPIDLKETIRHIHELWRLWLLLLLALGLGSAELWYLYAYPPIIVLAPAESPEQN